MGITVIAAGLFVVMVAALVFALMCDTPLRYDGESVCPNCGVIVCGFCQGLDPDCSNAHKPGCPAWTQADA